MSDDWTELDPTELLSTRATPRASAGGQQIGPYRLLQKLGEGGMGEVWEAEQTAPVKRRVALKVIKRGMDTKQVVARFEAERQALALMDHPSVAKVFDAGSTPLGLPYFVMEHVRGVPITEHCDRHKLTHRERLELFLQVCDGVQHAHQKAIIHRDLKPSNVLVSIQDGRSVPKIIDFGVAKATAQKLTERTMFTELGVLIGTPEYMSPEQAEMTGQNVDTRTDVYALGVMLYELLVGALPFDSRELRAAGFDGIRQKVREEEPPKPSARLGTLGQRSTESAERRGVDVPTLRRQLRGDLDWITMKALEKDRTRRYGSPSELAEDIRRHLRHEPVVASPPSATYRMGKFARRHRVGVSAAIATVLVLLGFAVTMTVQARRIAAERDRANRERETSERVSEFLADTLGNVDSQALGVALWKGLRERVAEVRRRRGTAEDEIEAVLTTLGDALSGVNATDAALRLLDEQVLSPAAETIERELSEEPRIAGRLEHTLGATYDKLGLHEQAERHFERAAGIRERAFGPEHPDTLASQGRLGSLYWYRRRYDEAETLLRETAEMQRRVLGPEHRDTLLSRRELSWVYFHQRRFAESEALGSKVLEAQRRVLGEDHPDTLKSMNGLSAAYWGQGRYAEGEALMREAVRIHRRARGEEHRETMGSMMNLAIFLSAQGHYAEAEALYDKVVLGRRRLLGDQHPRTLNTMNSLAANYSAQARYAEAEALSRATLDIAHRVLGEEHLFTLGSMGNLANAYVGQGRYAEAENMTRETLEIERRVLGEEHPDTRSSLYRVGVLALLRGDREAALGWFAQAVGNGFSMDDWTAAAETLRQLLGEDHPAPRRSLYYLGVVAALGGDRETALEWLGQAVEHGFSMSDWMARDSELESLRGDQEFEALVERARQNAAAQGE